MAGSRMASIRIDCPACRQAVAVTSRGRLYRHGSPPCPRRTVGRIWSAWHRGRRVQTIPGPDTWNPIEGAA